MLAEGLGANAEQLEFSSLVADFSCSSLLALGEHVQGPKGPKCVDFSLASLPGHQWKLLKGFDQSAAARRKGLVPVPKDDESKS